MPFDLYQLYISLFRCRSRFRAYSLIAAISSRPIPLTEIVIPIKYDAPYDSPRHEDSVIHAPMSANVVLVLCLSGHAVVIVRRLVITQVNAHHVGDVLSVDLGFDNLDSVGSKYFIHNQHSNFIGFPHRLQNSLSCGFLRLIAPHKLHLQRGLPSSFV